MPNAFSLPLKTRDAPAAEKKRPSPESVLSLFREEKFDFTLSAPYNTTVGCINRTGQVEAAMRRLISRREEEENVRDR